jgi:hypothetical protein
MFMVNAFQSASPNQYMIFETMFGVRLIKKSNLPCYIPFYVVVVVVVVVG